MSLTDTISIFNNLLSFLLLLLFQFLLLVEKKRNLIQSRVSNIETKEFLLHADINIMMIHDIFSSIFSHKITLQSVLVFYLLDSYEQGLRVPNSQNPNFY